MVTVEVTGSGVDGFRQERTEEGAGRDLLTFHKEAGAYRAALLVLAALGVSHDLPDTLAQALAGGRTCEGCGAALGPDGPCPDC